MLDIVSEHMKIHDGWTKQTKISDSLPALKDSILASPRGRGVLPWHCCEETT